MTNITAQNRTLNFGICTVWLVLKFYKIMILTTSKDCPRSVTKSQWVPKDFQGQNLMVYFLKILIAMLHSAHAFSEGGQISPNADSTRKVHMKTQNQKYSAEPKALYFFQDLNLIPHHSANMPEKAVHGKWDCFAAKDAFCSLNNPSSTTHILICAFLIEA